MNDKLHFLKDIAINAGSILTTLFRKEFDIEGKQGRELVTTADRKSEEFIISSIRKKYPEAGVVAEESNLKEWERNEVFIVDPLDGTNNFSYGIPFFCVSLAYELEGNLKIGVIYDPIHKELFSAQKGRGAKLNGNPISVSNRDKLIDSILATGFPYIRRLREYSKISEFSKFLMEARGIRRFGSAALDLAYVACGRLDGFWEKKLKPWDISAGGLLVREAGGRVSNFYKLEWNYRKDHIIASNGKIHSEMLKIIKRAKRVD